VLSNWSADKKSLLMVGVFKVNFLAKIRVRFQCKTPERYFPSS